MIHHIVGCLLLVLSVQGLPRKDDVCSLPSETGPCRAAFRRYYYNSNTGKCERFIYGGCKGNANNFESLSQCKARCGKSNKPGMCPPIGVGQVGHCAEMCGRYQKCPEGKMCCSNGCGHDCMTPVKDIISRPGHPCPEVQCNSKCKYGFKHDKHGCNTCTCKPSLKPICGPVCMIACPRGNVIDKHGCPTCKCKPGPIRPPFPCPMMKCAAIHCPYGFAKDKRGCHTCGCDDHPIHPPFPCPMIMCPHIHCPRGFATNKRGCQTCRCKDYPHPPFRGSCPRNARSNIGCPEMNNHDECTSDKECSSGKKCCHYGCKRKCIRPQYDRPIWLH